MSAPHPDAVGSYGPELEAWARDRFGMHPKRTEGHRYFQRLLYAAALQHDANGDLLFPTVLLGTARQSGKSWALREVCMWRLEQGRRWGELQTIVHCAAQLFQAEAVWKPAAHWAGRLPRLASRTPDPTLWDDDTPPTPQLGGYTIRLANGSAQLSRPDGSAWIPQAANDQIGVALSVSLAIVDEAWDVPRWNIDNGLIPTQAEARSPQLWITSTAGKPRTGEVSDLWPFYAAQARGQLTHPSDTLILEWSADPDADPGAVATWRQASPHWDDRRRNLLEREWRKVLDAPAGDKRARAEAAFRMQWLNIWPDGQGTGDRWLSSHATDAVRGELDWPDAGIIGLETRWHPSSDDGQPGRWAVACAIPAGDQVHVKIVRADDLPAVIRLAGDRRIVAHDSVIQQLQAVGRGWRTEPVKSITARSAAQILADLIHRREVRLDGISEDDWSAVRVYPSDAGDVLDARRSLADISAVKAASYAVQAVQAARHTAPVLVV